MKKELKLLLYFVLFPLFMCAQTTATEQEDDLEEIVIQAKQENEDARKKIYFINDSLRKNTQNTLQLLEKLQGIRIDWVQNTVNIEDQKDVLILLDDREVSANIVKNLNPERIKSI